MAKYAIYITVNPKDFLDIAAPINSIVAIKKKMYAQNIGGFGENHIKIPDATRSVSYTHLTLPTILLV